MIHLIGFLASAAGLYISLSLYYKKHAKKKLMCPRNADCNSVINSRFGVTLGISNEVFGIFYYLFLSIVFGSSLIIQTVFTPLTTLVVLAFTAIGLLVSVYLVSVQAFVIKAWCMWCLGSAFVNIVIFSSALLLKVS
jgi:uncharacterized membrane protein